VWRDPKYLLDMLLAARDAQEMIAKLSRDDFVHNRTAQLAAAHALQIIDEAANRVSGETQGLHPEIPWRQMIGMRKRLVHDYGHGPRHHLGHAPAEPQYAHGCPRTADPTRIARSLVDYHAFTPGEHVRSSWIGFSSRPEFVITLVHAER
jgi:uncharacterized protein with HEPN domain